jgi:uncharacterized protein (TIGR00299 family) protein
VIERSQRTFRLLAESEAAVHGVDPETVEFHEVGSLDAIADVVGVCLLLEQLNVDQVVAAPIVPGHGTVTCAHGRMPVPVPAVSEMLKRIGAPCRMLGRDTGELTTPTGCALVCALADRFLDGSGAPVTGRVLATGCGAGRKTIPGLANALRCTLVEPAAAAVAGEEIVCELRAHLDDATGEELAGLIDDLLAAGALDAALAPLVMKKGRPGHLLTVIASETDARRLAELVLNRSSAIGIRVDRVPRLVLPRRTVEVVIDGRPVPLKVVRQPDGRERAKPEHDAVRAAATALGCDPRTVAERALAAWRAGRDAS